MSTLDNHRSVILAADLRHNDHESNGTDVGALPAHVASSDDLKAGLLSRVYIVGYIFSLQNFFLDWMTALLDSQRVR